MCKRKWEALFPHAGNGGVLSEHTAAEGDKIAALLISLWRPL
jgi:hypothetical protein